MTAKERELIEKLEAANQIIARQAEQNAQQAEQNAQQAERNAQQAELIERLTKRIEQLEEQLRQNSSNSGKPPSSDSPSQRDKNRDKRNRRASKRKRGGQPGHKGSSRQLIPVDEVDQLRHVFVDQCSSCWESLPESACDAPKRYQVVDLVRGRVQVTEHQRHFAVCPHCGHKTWAPFTAIPKRAFGPGLASAIVMLTGVYHLSRRQTQRLLREFLGITISLGAISAIEQRAIARLDPLYAHAKMSADRATIKHTDGTGWRQAGVALQLWTVATSAVTVFSIVENGCGTTLQRLFRRRKGILVSDRAKALSFWAMNRRQICWSHLLRKFVAFSERDGPAGRIGHELVDTTAVLFETHRDWREGIISRRIFKQRMAPVRKQIEALLQQAMDAKIARLSGSCRDILDHQQALWTFVERRGVEPTNNHAERELRAFVLWRKKSFGANSDRGNRFAERIMTAVHSLRKQGRAVLDALIRLFRDPLTPPCELLAA